MSMQQDILVKFVRLGTNAWTNIGYSKKKKTNILNNIKNGLEVMASPMEENQVKVDIIRESCKKIINEYPNFSGEASTILNQFETHLRLHNMAVLPFNQLDKLTYRIFLNESLKLPRAS